MFALFCFFSPIGFPEQLHQVSTIRNIFKFQLLRCDDVLAYIFHYVNTPIQIYRKFYLQKP